MYSTLVLGHFPLRGRCFQKGNCKEMLLYTNVGCISTTCFYVLLDFSLTVKAATLIFISGRGSAISSANEGKSGFVYNLVES